MRTVSDAVQKRHKELLEYLQSLAARQGNPVTVSLPELAEYFNVRYAVIRQSVITLEEGGQIRREGRRSIVVLSSDVSRPASISSEPDLQPEEEVPKPAVPQSQIDAMTNRRIALMMLENERLRQLVFDIYKILDATLKEMRVVRQTVEQLKQE